jgi:hypothetical protein
MTMKRAFLFLLAFLAVGLGTVAVADPNLLLFVPSTTIVTFTNCANGGSAASTVTAGRHQLVVSDEDTYICLAATCAANGTRYPPGVYDVRLMESTSISCRSAGAAGDAQYTKAKE